MFRNRQTKRNLVVVLMALAVVAVFGLPAAADTVVSTAVAVTQSADYDTTPTLGVDATSEMVVYTSRALLPDGTYGPGDIMYQRLDTNGTTIGEVIKISDGTTDDKLNDVSGSRIVYTAFENTSSLEGKIMLYDLATDTTVALMSEADWVREARIDGDIVVWTQGQSGSTRVNYFDLTWPSGTTPGTIGGPNPPCTNVDIGGRYVVWERAAGGQNDIAGYGISGGYYVSVSADADLDERTPATFGDYVVWQATRSDGSMTIEIADMSVNPIDRYTAVDNGSQVFRPSIYGNLVAYEARDSSTSDLDIYLYRISDMADFTLTAQPDNQYLNNIFGDKVAYVDASGDALDIWVSTFEFVPVIFVDASASGGANDGSTWADAYNYLQDALAAATIEDEIWVAAGTYTPDTTGLADPREATFQLASGVAIYGGFASGGGVWENRDPNAYETILSGDLDGNDVSDLDDPSRNENSYHVVSANSVDANALLDGFTITAGNASEDWPSPYSCGGGMYNNLGSPTVTNCTFSGNSTLYYGGGMYNYIIGSPTVTNCTFRGNSAGMKGGGMSNHGGSPTVTHCTFSGNSASQGGGGMYNSYSSPILTNCAFIGNSATGAGAGMYNNFAGPTVSNCTFSGNSGYSGSGMYNAASNPTVTNCTFSGNIAWVSWGVGGGMYNSENSNPTVSNCILWGNTASEDGNEIALRSSSTIDVNYCDVQGGYGGVYNDGTSSINWGSGNIDADPLFVDADGPDDIVGTEDDNLRLSSGSPCIDAGDNTAVPSGITTDLNGNPRIVRGQIDMGAYEFQGPYNWYVDADASGANNGSNWADAYNYLQDALAMAMSGDKIWVAAGTYTPDPAGLADPREATFQLISGVGIKGGYAGVDAPDPDARDIELYETILSGDLDGNDVQVSDPCDLPTEPTRGENSYHVVTGSDTEPNAVLDGFTITAGNANGSSPNHVGGGMYNDTGSPTISNCTFSGNSADDDGGGMGNYYQSSPILTNCTFTGNSAGREGGGMYNSGVGGPCSPTLTNCTFSGNSAHRGGGMYNYFHSEPIVSNCTFSGNSAYMGGGMYSSNSSSPTLTNCILWGDSAHSEPEIYNFFSVPIVTYSDIGGGYGGAGNIDADPCFMDAANGDYHLLPGSLCIDAGDNSAVPSGVTTDLDGNPRFMDDPGTADTGNGTAPIVDMGAYERIWDSDGDGIEDSIDTEPAVDSNDFSDAATTYGTITDRGDQILRITDEPDPCGVRIRADAAGGTMPATVSTCGGETIYTLNAGDVAGDDEGIVTCGSAKIEVISGIIEITLVPLDGPVATTSLAAGNSLTFEAATLTITAPSTNSDVVVVVVEGEEFYLAPGETLIFNQPPVAVCRNVTVSAGPGCTANASVDDGSYDPDGDPITISQDPPGPYGLGYTDVTLTVTDDKGASDMCSATVTVVDTTPPDITCPADVTVECAQPTDPGTTGEATATDNCDNSPAIVYSDMISGTCPEVIERTWTATDESGNSSTCVQTITVVDTTPPVISCPSDLTLECDGSGNTAQISSWLASATASDTCSSAAITNDFSGLSDGCGATGTATVMWTAVDDCGNSASCSATVRVIDTTPPEITCPADVILECPADTAPSVTGEATATDTCGDVTITYSDVLVPGPGNTETITRTWTATDECGNSSSCVQTIAVVDTTPPTINSVSADPSVLRPPNHKMVDVTVTVDAEDICDPAPVCNIVNVTSNEPINGLGDGDKEPDWEITGNLTVKLRAERAGGGTGRLYTIHVECTDASGNTATAMVEVTVPHDKGKGKK